MKAKSKSNILLLSISLISIAIAIYFGVKLENVEKKLSLVKNNSKTVTDSLQLKQDKVIDSLLLVGDYKNAISNLDSINSNDITDRGYNNLRYILASEIFEAKVKISNLKKDIRNKSASDLNKTTIDNYSKNLDSLNLSLKIANIEITGLEKQLEVAGGNGYLFFKTSKGTQLHYVGAIKNDKANGYGIAILDSGSRYEGMWKNNERHGKGKFYWDDGDYYEGNYLNDKRNGYGVYHWKNGEKYVGEWKNDKRNGEGGFYNQNGKLKTKGVWKDDVFIE